MAAARDSGEASGIFVLANVPALESPRSVHRDEPPANPAQPADRGSDHEHQALPPRIGLDAELGQHFAHPGTVLELVECDLMHFGDLIRIL